MLALESILFYGGILVIIRVILSEFPSIMQLMASLITARHNLKEKYGSWAVVTGASDGIGKAYTFQLAQRGINIVLIGRNFEKLNKVASAVEELFSVETKVIVADFSMGRDIYADIQRQLEDIEVGILFNNVGVQYNYPMAVANLPDQEIWDNLNVNIAPTVMLTRFILPKMIAKNKGAIVNMCSMSSEQPQPYMTLYASSKIYLVYFSEALREEVKNTNITIQTLIPGYISSKINHFNERLQKVGLFTPDVDTYAAHAIETLGKLDYTTGYYTHRIFWILNKLAPRWCRQIIAGHLYKKMGNDFRSRMM